ncbi:hypothetical protein AQUCO_05600063v1 [Aquilegia coerulea]|uniref:Membrane insertase YidC/Oxa/ALB C-terminal domain-containing protein n=1 Tax=Aquilegia coerulea TaxID=218851 RepID=A0A2G5CGK2_AQUCA|nr:hypothetical protein AQUCO_05600063v1 [Aquilegia coerulea]PIA30369.1 hypothetical protein AQUCO_05600063v1 [Aquilegia coerulea]PIA30370.1 hypothetical protein AQUCO_05600063v1 [Aquilegia coerulea]PIA30371.1 hypothetical protein AQUCO_05600063v1 [Aquilegia coerulea]
MATILSLQPQSLLQSPIRTSSNSLLLSHKSNFFTYNKPCVRQSIGVIRFSLKPPSSFPDLDGADAFIQHLFSKTESLLYTLADAAVSASSSTNGVKENGDWFTGITNIMEIVLKVLKDGLSAVNVPYSYGFAIILLTVLVKAVTFPLTKKQVESAMAMRSLQPQIKAIQQEHAGDQEKIQLKTAQLYKIAGVNPLAGCLPTVATIPVWIGLYRALSNVANEGLLTEGFFWIPSLAGPTTVAARQNGSGVSWLFPFVDGHPPLGWSDTLAYLVLPLLLIVSQYISVQIIQSSQSNDPNMKSSQAVTKVLPLMIGYFALSVPSGLSLYWFTNNILSTAQQIWLQKFGGAKNPVMKFTDTSIKEVQQQLQESVTKINSTKEVKTKEENSSGGPRPGDRFKQLKEQEARKKQQREAEKRKLTAKVTETLNNEKKELKSSKTENEVTLAEPYDIRNKRPQPVTDSHSSRVNGDHSIQSSNEENIDMSVPKSENGGFASTSGVDEKKEILLQEKLDKDDRTEMCTTATTTTSASGVGSSDISEHKQVEPSKRDEN